MANRIVIQADIDFYAAQFVGFPIPMQLGDVILNTPTGPAVEGKFPLFYSSVNTTFGAARLGANIWFDGTALGTLYDCRITNGGGGVEWAISDSTHIVTFLPIPNTQVKIWRNSSSNSGYTMLVLDIKYWRIWGENDAYPGMRDGVGLHTKHIRGTFGFWISGEKELAASHAFSTDALDEGSMEMIGIEIEHHFSGSRFTGGSYTRIVRPIQRRCYIHDGVSGEGDYWGATHGLPFAALVAPTIIDCIITRRAAESIQVQHFIHGSVPSKISRNVVKDGAIDYVDAFQPYQDSGIQLSVEGGNNFIENNIVDEGGASNTFVTYSDNAYGHDGINKTTTVRNNCFLGGDIFLYINVSCIHDVKWVFRDNTIGRFIGRYQEDSQEPVRDYAIGANNGTDKFIFIGNKFDTTKSAVFQSEINFDKLDNTTEIGIPTIEYIDSGFLPGERPVKWAPFWGGYHPNPPNTPYNIYTDRIYVNAVDGVEYRFYKALTNHAASAVRRPDLYPTGFMLLSWDTNRVRNDQPNWNSGDVQDYYPTDDLRLVANHPYNKLKRGLLSNPQNTDYTIFQWFRAKNALGLDEVAIPGGKERKYTPELADLGRYLRRGIRVKDLLGNLSAWSYSNYQLVN